VRQRQGKTTKKTITGSARFFGSTAWKAALKGLTKGTWRFSATAWDGSGNKMISPKLTAIIA
jgi:hypothetical protein